MFMIVQMFIVGRFLTNCYVVGCEQTKESIIIDPGFDEVEVERAFEFIDSNALMLKLIVNTHGHPDHTCGNGVVTKRFHTPILIHEYDAHMVGKTSNKIAELFGFEIFSPPADMLLHNGDMVKFGKITLKVIHTPGHSRGSVSLLGEKEVFTGDTLFAGSIGRTDFPESSKSEMSRSLRKLANLPNHLVVYPGHGPITTIAKEKRSNPFLEFL
ncbi:MAG: MBL fold metallo-hydrolase [Candidatus Bathyarchaeota archaeon]|nr:MBL fold metallo-hydrolase [Candidatus Bathyarchaeota archaeon]